MLDLSRLIQDARSAGLQDWSGLVTRLEEIQRYPSELQEFWVRDLFSGYVCQIAGRAPDIQEEWRKYIALLEKHGATVLMQKEREAYQNIHDAYMAERRRSAR